MLVGRREEIQSLNEAFQGKSSEFIALFGRRRVGKTFLMIMHIWHSAMTGEKIRKTKVIGFVNSRITEKQTRRKFVWEK